MILRKGIKYRLDPTRANRQDFACFAGCSRYVFNRGLDERIKEYDSTGKNVSHFQQNKNLTQWKREEGTAWLKQVHSQVLQQSLKDLDSAFQHFFRRCKQGEKPGFPCFKSKGEHDSFRFPQSVKVSGNKVYLPKIGWVRFRKSREIPGVIKQATVSRDGKHWNISFSCEIVQPDPKPPVPDTEEIIGIDLGIQYFLAAVRGTESEQLLIQSPAFLERDLERIRFLSRSYSRKKKGSANREKCRRKLADAYRKVKNRRLDFLHKLSTMIVKSHDVICVENLNIKKMLEDGCRSLSRRIADSGWRTFLNQIKYKAIELGKAVIEMSPYHPSSQLCSSCGSRRKMPLHRRQYDCAHCGFSEQRDINSALGIKAAGTSAFKKACGAIV